MRNPCVVIMTTLLCRRDYKNASHPTHPSLICYKHNRKCPCVISIRFRMHKCLIVTDILYAHSVFFRNIAPKHTAQMQETPTNRKPPSKSTTKNGLHVTASRLWNALCCFSPLRGDRSGRPHPAPYPNSPRRDHPEFCADRCPQSCRRVCYRDG